MKQESVRIVQNQQLTPDTYHMVLSGPQSCLRALPGQFVMLRLPEAQAHLLPRPFSIHGIRQPSDVEPAVEILYKVVGALTAAMARLQAGQTVEVMGPLGNGFEPPAPDDLIYIVAGGMGVAPMRFLADWLRRRGHSRANTRIFLGARCEAELVGHSAFVADGWAVACTTDDGSTGVQCLITHPLEEAVQETPPAMIYACGPEAMLACVAGIAGQYQVACQVSVEARMACGMGACLGCAVAADASETQYWHVCKDGPVFDAAQLKW